MEDGDESIDESTSCDPNSNDDDGKGTLIDSAKLSGWLNDERTRNVPWGNWWSDKTSVTISLKLDVKN